jgi:hypothetical protein
MTPVVKLYWIRVALGVIAAAITAVAAILLGNETNISSLLNSISIAIIVYFISYYALRPVFKSKIEKQSKILSTGIGIYFFTWIAFFVLIYTAIKAFMPV